MLREGAPGGPAPKGQLAELKWADRGPCWEGEVCVRTWRKGVGPVPTWGTDIPGGGMLGMGVHGGVRGWDDWPEREDVSGTEDHCEEFDFPPEGSGRCCRVLS